MTAGSRSSRRDLIRLGLGAGAFALAGCGTAAPASPAAVASSSSATAAAPAVGSASSAMTSSATVSASAPPSAAAPGGAATVVYYNWFGPADPQNQVFPHASDLFKQQHPGVVVNNNVEPGTPAQLESKLEVLIAGGTPPDVSALNPQLITPLYSKQLLADLSADIKRDAATFDPGDFFPQSLTRVIKDGKQYAVPLQMGLFVIIYNRTLFQAAGVAEPNDTWHWDTEFVDAAKKLTSNAKRQFGAVPPPIQPPIWAYGGDVLSEDGKTCLLDQPPAIAALQWMSDLVFKYQVAPKPADMQGINSITLFTTGRLAMDIDITGTVSQIERQKLSFDWDLAHLPMGPKGRYTMAQGPSLAVFNAAKQRDLAWQWTELYTGKDIQQYAAKVGRVVSARQSAASAYESLPPPPAHRAPLIDSATFSRQQLFLTNWAQFNDVLTKNLDDALTLGTKTAQTAAQTACQQIQPLLKGS